MSSKIIKRVLIRLTPPSIIFLNAFVSKKTRNLNKRVSQLESNLTTLFWADTEKFLKQIL